MTATAFPLCWPDGWPSCGAKYEVSADGQVFRVHQGSRHVLAQQPDQDGYPCVLVRIALGKRRLLRVHRAVCLTFHGPRPSPKHVVRHLDGDKRNNSAANLSWGTHLENEADSVRLRQKASGLRNGAHTKPERRRRGEANGNAKITADAARRIAVDARPQHEIAVDHGVSQTLVSLIKRGRVWSCATGIETGGSHEAMAELNAAQEKALQEVFR